MEQANSQQQNGNNDLIKIAFKDIENIKKHTEIEYFSKENYEDMNYVIYNLKKILVVSFDLKDYIYFLSFYHFRNNSLLMI